MSETEGRVNNDGGCGKWFTTPCHNLGAVCGEGASRCTDCRVTVNNDPPRTYGRGARTLEDVKRLFQAELLSDLIAHIEELQAEIEELRDTSRLYEYWKKAEAKLQAAERVVEAARVVADAGFGGWE